MRRITHLFACVLLPVAAGCTNWRPAAIPEPVADAPRSVRSARVTSVDDAVFVLADVKVTADSVTGWHEVSTGLLQRPSRHRIAMHRSEVRSFEEGEPDLAWTGVLAFLATCGMLVLLEFSRSTT